MLSLSKLKIRQKLTIVIGVVSAMALGIFATITINDSTQNAREELTNQALLLSEVGVNALEAPLLFNDKKTTSETLAILGASHSLVFADIHDVNWDLFAQQQFRPFLGPDVHQHHTKMQHATEIEYHDTTLHLARPIKSDGKIIGYLHLTFDLTEKLAALKYDGFIAILIASALLLVCMLLALILGRFLTDPILELSNTMKEISISKDFSHSLEVKSQDEVGELTSGFNSMLEGLAQRDSELEEYREDLEKLVEERTHELATTNDQLTAEIRQRERIAQDLRKAKDEAEDASRTKSEFLANMSHEIRTPMNGVLGMTELLAKTRLDERQQQLVSTVLQSGHTLLRVINDILDFSRMGAEQFSLEMGDFDLHSAAEQTVDLYSEMAKNKNITLELNIQDTVPDVVIGDESRLRQVLGNIINNAIKFTLKGKVSVYVKAREKDGYSEVSFEVSDTGIGIADSNLDLIFDPFQQADGSTSRRFGGTGLGLVIAKNIIEKMGGTITVESVLGKGSVFAIHIPFEARVEESVHPANNRRNTHTGQFEKAEDKPQSEFRYSALVLVAEDNAVNQEVVKENLLHYGCTVEIAENGEQAVKKWETFSPDLILMDCQMPEMDGFQATQIIRKHEEAQGKSEHVPIIALTAHVLQSDRDKCLAAGMDGHLAKPFSDSELVGLLEMWLAAKKEQQEQGTGRKNSKNSPATSPSPESDVIATDPIDYEKLDEIRNLFKDNSEGFARTIQLFLTSSTDALQKIDTSLVQSDLDGVRQTAHSLKSSSSNVGAVEFSQLWRQLESEARENASDKVAITLAQLKTEFGRVKEALKIIIGQAEKQAAS